MVKRKEDLEILSDSDDNSLMEEYDAEAQVTDEEENIIDVDFDFFSLRESDFHAIKRLLLQLFDGPNCSDINLSELCNLIVEQTNLGSTVKVDGEDSDPLAIISVLPLSKCPKVLEYIKNNINDNNDNLFLESLLKDVENHPKIGWIFSERFINMPPQICGPLWRLLLNEIRERNVDFEYYFLISKTFMETEPDLKTPKSKKNKIAPSLSCFYQPEDEIIQKYAPGCVLRHCPSRVKDVNNVFFNTGVEVGRYFFCIKNNQLESLVKEVEETII